MMTEDHRESGIDVVGDVPWGTHLCMFYGTSRDLAEILVPYFKTGLENNEFCVWVCWEPLLREKAIAEISKEVGDLEAYISKGQIEIVDYAKQYTTQGKTGFDEMVEFWIDKEKLAFERGFQGLRLAGNTYWLERQEWQDFMRYEAKVDEVIRSHRMIAICPYSLDKCNAADALDVMSSHRFALIRKEGKWDVIQSLEEQRLHMALESQMQNFRNSLDDSPLGVRIVTAEGELLYANKAILDIYGYSSFEELKSTPTEQRYTPESYAEHRERARKRKQGEFVPSSYEISIVRKDGEVRQLQVFRKEVLWNGEKQYQAIYQDVTERKKAEEREKQLQQELIVASRLASIGRMASGIAHEINNPLTGVVGFSDLLLKRDMPEDIRESVRIIYDGAQRVAGITSRLLTFAHQYKPERTYVNINDVIGNTLALRAYELRNSNIEATTQLDPGLPCTMADAGQLQQVFLNIVLNAETEMTRAHGRGNLLVKTERMDNAIRISFNDDGPGMPKEHLDKIFDPFFTTREVGQGTGLGLSVSHGIVTEHGGKIYAQSESGKGAAFVVELPIVTEAEQLKPVEPPAAQPKKGSGGRILVVDDEPLVQQLLTRVLSEEGHEVETADNGDDALQKLQSEDYDIILVDIKLPRMSGIEIYEQLQRHAKPLASRVVFITGDVMSEDTMAFLSRAKARYITKPFDTERLRKDINSMLGGQK